MSSSSHSHKSRPSTTTSELSGSISHGRRSPEAASESSGRRTVVTSDARRSKVQGHHRSLDEPAGVGTRRALSPDASQFKGQGHESAKVSGSGQRLKVQENGASESRSSLGGVLPRSDRRVMTTGDSSRSEVQGDRLSKSIESGRSNYRAMTPDISRSKVQSDRLAESRPKTSLGVSLRSDQKVMTPDVPSRSKSHKHRSEEMETRSERHRSTISDFPRSKVQGHRSYESMPSLEPRKKSMPDERVSSSSKGHGYRSPDSRSSLELAPTVDRQQMTPGVSRSRSKSWHRRLDKILSSRDRDALRKLLRQ